MVNVTDGIGIDGMDRNWTVQRWHAPRVMDGGFHAGKLTNGHWEVLGYYRDIGDALKKALDEAVKDLVTSGTVTTLDGLAGAVAQARAACVEAGRVAVFTGAAA